MGSTGLVALGGSDLVVARGHVGRFFRSLFSILRGIEAGSDGVARKRPCPFAASLLLAPAGTPLVVRQGRLALPFLRRRRRLDASARNENWGHALQTSESLDIVRSWALFDIDTSWND